MPTHLRDGYLADLRHFETQARRAITSTTAASRASTFRIWQDFAQEHGLPPYLEGLRDPLGPLKVFAVRYRTGRLSRSGKPVRAGTVSDALLAVGEEIRRMVDADPRLQPGTDKLRRPLKDYLRALARDDPPPTRLQPVSLAIIRHLLTMAPPAETAKATTFHATRDLIIIGFFFLLRAGEYVWTSNRASDARSSPFRICDVTFAHDGNRSIPAASASLNDVNQATFVSLTFTDQKNCTRGETIGHSITNDPSLCPVRALARRISHLRGQPAPATTPIYAYRTTAWKKVTASAVTSLLRKAAHACRHHTGIQPHSISCQSLRPAGATALLVARVDPSVIRLIGHWKSDAMFQYLRAQAFGSPDRYAQRMLDHGDFKFSTTPDPDFLPTNIDPDILHAKINDDLADFHIIPRPTDPPTTATP